MFKIPKKLELNSQWIELLIDQIWNSHPKQDLSLVFGPLRLDFLIFCYMYTRKLKPEEMN